MEKIFIKTKKELDEKIQLERARLDEAEYPTEYPCILIYYCEPTNQRDIDHFWFVYENDFKNLNTNAN